MSIRVIASPQLSAEDIDALRSVATPDQRRQYEAVVVGRIVDDIIRFAQSPGDCELRARIFAWLVARERMTIKFAFATHVAEFGIFHEKIGVFERPRAARRWWKVDSGTRSLLEKSRATFLWLNARFKSRILLAA